MVGSQTENLESGQNINGSLNMPIDTIRSKCPSIKMETIDCVLSPASPASPPSSAAQLAQINSVAGNYRAASLLYLGVMELPQLTSITTGRQFPLNSNSNSNTTPCTVDDYLVEQHESITSCVNDNADHTFTTQLNNSENSMQSSAIVSQQSTAATTSTTNFDDVIYSSYDDESETNCNITMILHDEDISHFEEVIEEVGSDEEDDHMSILSPIPTNYPSPGYGSCYMSNGDLKSPISTYTDRDSAYDSVTGSPPPAICSMYGMNHIDEDHPYDELWHDSFSELFPSLA